MCMWYNIYKEKENERSRIVGKKSRKHERGEITMVGIFVTVMICGGIGMTTLSLCQAAKWGDEAPTSDHQS